MTILIMTAVLAAENESLRYVHEGCCPGLLLPPLCFQINKLYYKTQATDIGMFHTNVLADWLTLAAVSEAVIWKGTGLSGRSRKSGLWDNAIVLCIRVSACIKATGKHLQGFTIYCQTECQFTHLSEQLINTTSLCGIHSFSKVRKSKHQDYPKHCRHHSIKKNLYLVVNREQNRNPTYYCAQSISWYSLDLS